MRPKFFQLLYEAMKNNPNIWLLVGDLGYGGADKIRDEFPERFVNYGAAEFAMVSGAVGLSLAGKIPVCYTITPFYFRAFEMIRNYIDHENIPVVLVGSGRGKDYEHDGFSHYAGDDWIFEKFENITCEWPETNEEVEEVMEKALEGKKAHYINLARR